MELTVKRLAASLLSRFRTSERGAILVEAFLIIPVIALFAVAVLEFGYIFWERQQMQAGVRDAARYWSRCSLLAFNAGRCTPDKARRIAVTYYDPAADVTYARLNGWNASTAASVVITPTTPPTTPTSDSIVTVTGTVQHDNSPLFVLLRFQPVTITYQYSLRYVGW